jgi:hypothetical protein
MYNGRQAGKRSWSLVVLVILCASIAGAASPQAVAPSPPLANWMATYSCAIQDELLTGIYYPAAHDAGTAGIGPDSVLMKDPYLTDVLQQVMNFLVLLSQV